MEVTAKYYVGSDVHKDTIAIAYAEAGSREEPRFLGTAPRIGSDRLPRRYRNLASRSISPSAMRRVRADTAWFVSSGNAGSVAS